MKSEILEKYRLIADKVPAEIEIISTKEGYVPIYNMRYPKVSLGTQAILDSIKEELIKIIQLTPKEFVDPSTIYEVKERFLKKAIELISKTLPNLPEKEKEILTGNLIHEMLGLNEIELLLVDGNLEEIVINGSKENIWVYHKKYGWLETNIKIKDEEKIYNYSSSIGRRVGRQITNLTPLMDAHLYTGDRVNATLSPISTIGNTLTIRKFARSPWTIVNFIDPKINTISKEAASLLWLAVQYELNILIAGGTASGKTSFLNSLMPFIPPNQRIISIEDTREINLPDFLHWVPFSSREPNPEGKGGVTMLDLLINSLRMRPDRIVVGEIRRTKEAEVMFEAIRTGHSAYATFHADKANETYKRLTNPPMNLPESILSALHLIVVQYRHRRKGVRRTLEIAELIPLEEMSNKLNIVYRWDPKKDRMEKINRLLRVFNEINLYTGMSEKEIQEDINNKSKILGWMVDHNIKTVNTVGKIIAEYYKDEKNILKTVKNNDSPKEVLGILMKELKQG